MICLVSCGQAFRGARTGLVCACLQRAPSSYFLLLLQSEPSASAPACLRPQRLLPMDTKECQTKVALPEVDLRAKLGTSPSGSSPALGGAGGSRDVKPGMASFSTSKHSVFISQTIETKRGEEGEKRTSSPESHWCGLLCPQAVEVPLHSVVLER